MKKFLFEILVCVIGFAIGALLGMLYWPDNWFAFGITGSIAVWAFVLPIVYLFKETSARQDSARPQRKN